jgi:hypothetical protein
VTIDAGWTVVALAGPVAADGYDWYLVQLTPEYAGSARLGWAANPQSGDEWLVPAAFDCPGTPPDLAGAIDLEAPLLLHCFGDDDLTLEGYVVTGFGCNVMGTFEPAWLAHSCANMSFISPVATSDGDGQLFLHYPAPGVTNPTLEVSAGQAVRIRGHFDDAAATDCVMEGTDETAETAAYGAARDPIADVAQCRLRFVVTEVSVLP